MCGGIRFAFTHKKKMNLSRTNRRDKDITGNYKKRIGKETICELRKRIKIEWHTIYIYMGDVQFDDKFTRNDQFDDTYNLVRFVRIVSKSSPSLSSVILKWEYAKQSRRKCFP